MDTTEYKCYIIIWMMVHTLENWIIEFKQFDKNLPHLTDDEIYPKMSTNRLSFPLQAYMDLLSSDRSY